MATAAEKLRERTYKANRAHRGINILYSRNDDSVALVALPGSTRTTIEDSETRIQLRSNVWDFLILASELVIDDVQIYPRAGDEITMIDDGSVYRVIRELAGEPCWRWSGNVKVVMRIHTDLLSGT